MPLDALLVNNSDEEGPQHPLGFGLDFSNFNYFDFYAAWYPCNLKKIIYDVITFRIVALNEINESKDSKLIF